MKYNYHVVYKSQEIFGSLLLNLDERISYNNIDAIQKRIEKELDDDTVIITNWILLDGPEYPNDTKMAVLEFSAVVKGKLLSALNNSEDNSEKKKAFALALNAVLEAEGKYL